MMAAFISTYLVASLAADRSADYHLLCYLSLKNEAVYAVKINSNCQLQIH